MERDLSIAPHREIGVALGCLCSLFVGENRLQEVVDVRHQPSKTQGPVGNNRGTIGKPVFSNDPPGRRRGQDRTSPTTDHYHRNPDVQFPRTSRQNLFMVSQEFLGLAENVLHPENLPMFAFDTERKNCDFEMFYTK
jgi:hypothetical protein